MILNWFGRHEERREPEPDLSAMSREALCTRLEEVRTAGDFVNTAKAYYELGVRFMEDGDPARAILYLCRCDSFAGAADRDAMGGELLDDCSARLVRLGQQNVLTSEIIAQVVERTAVLSDLQVREWGLLTMARLAKVGRRLSTLQGCQALGRLGQTVKLVLRSLYAVLSPEETGFLRESCSQLYHLVDSPYLLDADSRVPAPGGYLEAMDLNGGMTYTQLNLYLESHLHFLSGQDGAPEARLVPCALLSDYYLRTREGPLENMAPIRAELGRIQDDQKFLLTGPSREALRARIQAYLMMDILETP